MSILRLLLLAEIESDALTDQDDCLLELLAYDCTAVHHVLHFGLVCLDFVESR